MAKGTVTRTLVYALAYAWAVNGNHEDGSPAMEKVGFVEFASTKPNQTQAYRALKQAGVKCTKDFVGFDVTEEKVYAMDLDTFLEHAVVVERKPNGRVVGMD